MNEVRRARSGIVARGGARGRVRSRAPDEKTIRVVLDRLDPRALARTLLGCARTLRTG